MICAALLVVMAAYLACGLVFAVPFVVAGVGKCDPHAKNGSWGFRILILPGTMAFWPVLIRRWIRGEKPPEERNAHRLLSQEKALSGESADPATACRKRERL